jgi:hypothetical protein
LIVASAKARLRGGRWGKSSNNYCGQSSGSSLVVIIGHGRDAGDEQRCDEEEKDVGGEKELG